MPILQARLKSMDDQFSFDQFLILVGLDPLYKSSTLKETVATTRETSQGLGLQ